jgi:CheY-like chemotaxis protein
VRVDQMQRLDSLGQLAGGIAHDFNNILGIISGFTELIRGDLPDGSAEQRLADQIGSAVDKGTALTRQLLTFGRGQAGDAEVQDLHEVLADLGPLLLRTLGEHVTLHLPAPGQAHRPCLTRVDRSRLDQVVVNLAVNARDAMPGGGDLHIRCEHALLDPAELEALAPDAPARPEFVRLAVSDTGTGMDAEALARAFEPFFTTKPTGKGTGLGLASVYAIVRNAGGLVRLESEPGVGTTVNVYLPAHQRPAQASPAAVPDQVTPPAGLRVLVVDDCAELAEVTGKLLTATGYQVTTADTPAEALHRLDRGPDVDLLITDVVMPKMTGPELAAAARERHPALPVVYMSGYRPASLDERIRVDRDAVLVDKPLTRTSLLDAIGRLLGPESRSGPGGLRDL